MSVPTDEARSEIKSTLNTLNRSKNVFKALSPLFARKSPISHSKEAVDSDRIFTEVQPSQKVKKVSLETLSTPFFQKLFKKPGASSSPFKKSTYAQPYFLWKTKRRCKKTPEFLIFERYEEKIEDYPDENLLTKAQLAFSCKGELKQTQEGFFYLDISEEFIDKIFPHILAEGAHKPFFPMGAHIPVISCEESEIYPLPKDIPELGQTFTFTLKKIMVIHPNSHHLEKVWALSVHSDEIMHFREKYHLTSKLCSQDFMIILGAKPKKEKTLSKKSEGFFRVNPAQLQA